jgi:hypothetical protein
MFSLNSKLAGLMAAAVFAASTGAAFAQTVHTSPMTQAQMNASPKIRMAQIDVSCDTMVQQQKLIKPVHLVLSSSTWKLVDDAGYAAAAKTAASVTLVDVWKQNGKYVWVHSHRFTAAGAQSATQLCFGTSGTLIRVKQAATIPALDAADAVRAYYDTNGSLVAKIGAYEANDPAIAKSVKALPYYKNLP